MKINSKKERVLSELEQMFSDRLNYVSMYFANFDKDCGVAFEATLQSVGAGMMEDVKMDKNIPEEYKGLFVLFLKSNLAEMFLLRTLIAKNENEW